MHHSGTKLISEYLDRFFKVEVEPKARRRHRRWDTGTVELANQFKIWKHTVPCEAVLGSSLRGKEGGGVAVLFMVREVFSWMRSLSNDAYEIFPAERPFKRRQGKADWMLRPVTLRTRPPIHEDPLAGRKLRFASVAQLWAQYVRGYRRASMLARAPAEADAAAGGPEAQPLFVRVVRFEDVVLRPGEVVEELTRLGLPRNDSAFAPIPGGRSEIARRVRECLSVGGAALARDWLTDEQVAAVQRDVLAGAGPGYGALLEPLGYGYSAPPPALGVATEYP